MSKFEVRARTEITFDFVINADDADDAEQEVKNYLRYVDGGKIDGQGISVRVADDDKLTHCFVMDIEVCDVNEA